MCLLLLSSPTSLRAHGTTRSVREKKQISDAVDTPSQNYEFAFVCEGVCEHELLSARHEPPSTLARKNSRMPKGVTRKPYPRNSRPSTSGNPGPAAWGLGWLGGRSHPPSQNYGSSSSMCIVRTGSVPKRDDTRKRHDLTEVAETLATMKKSMQDCGEAQQLGGMTKTATVSATPRSLRHLADAGWPSTSLAPSLRGQALPIA